MNEDRDHKITYGELRKILKDTNATWECDSVPNDEDILPTYSTGGEAEQVIDPNAPSTDFHALFKEFSPNNPFLLDIVNDFLNGNPFEPMNLREDKRDSHPFRRG